MFLDVVDAAQRFFKNGEDPYIWFDIFSVSQHKSDLRNFEWWNSIFLNAVGDIGKVLMMMQPFQTTVKDVSLPPWTTLTRVWCVFELYACEVTKSKFEITMSEEMYRMIMTQYQNDPEEILRSLTAIDCAQSTAHKEEDRKRVFEVIKKSVGFRGLNRIVQKKVMGWLEEQVASIKTSESKRVNKKSFDQRNKSKKSRQLLTSNPAFPGIYFAYLTQSLFFSSSRFPCSTPFHFEFLLA